jgi:hypothetical protein
MNLNIFEYMDLNNNLSAGNCFWGPKTDSSETGCTILNLTSGEVIASQGVKISAQKGKK